MVAFIPIIFVILVIAVIYLVANMPEICLLGICYSPIKPHIASKLNFYFFVFLWFLTQAVVIYFYYKLAKWILLIPRRYHNWIDRTVNFVKKILAK